MSWIAKDALSHTRMADSPAKRKKWAAIANDAFRTYEEDEARAVATANSAMHDRFWDGDNFLKNTFASHITAVDRAFDRAVKKDDDEEMEDDDEEMEDDDDDDDGDDDDDDDDDGDINESDVTDYKPPFHDAIYDREWTAEQRKSAASEGEAMPGGGFPIKTKSDLMKARKALGRAGNRAAAIKHIKKRAKALGVDLGEGWPESKKTDAALPIVTGGVRSSTTIRMYDTIEMDDASKVRVLENGYIAAMPRIARTGIQVYSGRECGRNDMDLVKVYRPASAVFANDAVHSYTHIPVTLEHPSVAVDSSNWKKYAVGEVGDEVLRDGTSVRVPLMLRDGDAIKAFRNGKNQLSVGYDCDLNWVPGITEDGEEYHALQDGIRANHLAVVGAARAGPEFKIGDSIDNLNLGDNKMNMKTILVDGLEVQVMDSAATIIQRYLASVDAQLQNLRDKFKKKEEEEEESEEENCKKDAALKAKDKEITDSKKAIEVKDGEIAALKKQLDEEKLKSSPAAIDAASRERAAVVVKAQQLLGGKLKTDGMSVPDIRRAVVDARIQNCKDWSDDRVGGAFDALQSNAFADHGPRRVDNTLDDAVSVFGRPGVGYQTPQQLRDKAYNDYDSGISEAWRGNKSA